jgi:transcription initiation factor TFIIIB Brf1 subunit/transcription initiation factor TFIIB
MITGLVDSMENQKESRRQKERKSDQDRRLKLMEGYMTIQCTELGIDEKYKARAIELLPKACVIGTRDHVWSSNGRTTTGTNIQAIVDALLYAVIIESSGLECSLVANQLAKHIKHKRNRLIREVRLACGIKGHAYPVLSRSAIEQLGLSPVEADDIKALLSDKHYRDWVGVSPAGVASAVVYLYGLRTRNHDQLLAQSDIAKAFCVSEVCLRFRVRDIQAEAGMSA